MKKIMVSFVVLISVFLLAGCGSGQQGITPVGTRIPTVQATVTTSGTASATPSPGPTSPINALWMSDATTGWARTTTHRILHTTDGGKSWQDVTPPYPAGSTVQLPPAFAFLSGTVAWVAVFEKQQPDGTIPNVLIRTSDGGHTWQEAMLPRSELGVSQVQFVNAQDGWVLASYGGVAAGSQAVDLFRSTDGGRTWSTVARAGNPPGSLPFAGDKSGMGWASATTGWITGSIATNTVFLYRTQDGGVSWRLQSLPSSSFSPVQTLPPVFFSATEGLLPVTFFNGEGSGLAFYVTHDGGATWSSSTPLSMAGSVWDFLTTQQGWVVGANGTTLDETSDGGQHWTAITPSANFRHISQLDFVSAHEGWAISTATPDAPLLLKTMDGGQTWVQVSSSCGTWSVVPSPNGNGSSVLRAVATVSATDVWAVGGGQLAGSKTLIEHWDGAHWSVVTSPNPGSIYDILDGVTAVSATDVWAVGYDSNTGGVAQTLTEHWNGTSWQVVPSPSVGTSSTFWAVGAVSAKDVWAVGDTANGNRGFQTLTEQWNGSRWSVVTSPSPGSTNTSLNGVAAISASSVWAVGNAESSTLTEHYQC